jgi:hypothetical protein
MAVTVDVLKLTQVQGVVAVRGVNATGTIALATTLKKDTETQSSPEANIKSLQWTLGAGVEATLTRNSKVLYTMTGYGQVDMYGWADSDENGSDIEIAIDNGGTGGSVIVECSKVSGYGPQGHQGADGDLG